jgi:thymidylate kinase
VLEVDPEVAITRTPDHDTAAVRRKSQAALELAIEAEARHRVRVIRVDANQPLDAVLVEVKARLWDAL